MSWFSRGIERAAQQGAKSALDKFCAPGGELERIVQKVVWETVDRELPWSKPLAVNGFVWALRHCYRRRGCSYVEASDLANSTLVEFLADEKIKFGNRNYAWTREGAEAVAEEYGRAA